MATIISPRLNMIPLFPLHRFSIPEVYLCFALGYITDSVSKFKKLGRLQLTTFVPIHLKEESAPSHAAQCERCELSEQRHRVIWGEGNPNAPIFIILDNPGLREDKEGNPFVCGTRETLQIAMKEAGLDVDLVYVTYLLKCRPVRAYNKPLAREACRAHLQFQFNEKQPSILLGLGNVVVQELFPDVEADVKSYRGKWHEVQGIPAAFSYHPLAVRRRPVLMKYLVEDIKLVVEKTGKMM